MRQVHAKSVKLFARREMLEHGRRRR